MPSPVQAQPQKLLNLQRPLTAAEIETVVGGIFRALNGKTLRLVHSLREGRSDSEMLMGQNGAPRVIRSEYDCIEIVNGECLAGRVPERSVTEQPERFVNLTVYTGTPGRRCNGMPAVGEMVVDYFLRAATQTWTAMAREKKPDEPTLLSPLEMLRATASLSSSELRTIGKGAVRVFELTSPLPGSVIVTGDPAPNPADFVPVESLHVDTQTVLPTRWEVTQRQAIVAAVDFVYQVIDLRPPVGIREPACIP